MLGLEMKKMTDFIKLTCTSCGGKLNSADTANHLICGNCGSEFMVKQSGDKISLVPVSTKNSEVVGNQNVVVRIHNVASQENTGGQEVKDIVLCPICGRHVSRQDTFQCRYCQRTNICVYHQDRNKFICSGCVEEAALAWKKRPKYFWAFIINIFLGIGLFYVDPKTWRKWLYPILIILSWVTGTIIMNDGDIAGEGFIMGSMLIFFISFIDVIVTCVKRRREIKEMYGLDRGSR
jgi:predicted RNA-binding Zn-ribbon protein involved in translation (DUF1610 family)